MNKSVIDKTKQEGIRQGIWLCVQSLVDLEDFVMARYFIRTFGFDKNECEELLSKNNSNYKMGSFVAELMSDKNDNITLENIGYHKIGSIFKYNIDSKEVELEVVESRDYSCAGCAFKSKRYFCKDTYCADTERYDYMDVIYKEVKRS